MQLQTSHVRAIAGALLIGPLAYLDNRDSTILGHVGDEVQRLAYPVRQWLVLGIDQAFQIPDHVLFGDEDFVVVRPKPSCYLPRIRHLIQMRMIAEAYGKGIYRTVH